VGAAVARSSRGCPERSATTGTERGLSFSTRPPTVCTRAWAGGFSTSPLFSHDRACLLMAVSSPFIWVGCATPHTVYIHCIPRPSFVVNRSSGIYALAPRGAPHASSIGAFLFRLFFVHAALAVVVHRYRQVASVLPVPVHQRCSGVRRCHSLDLTYVL
jgi:hypothetical protein